MNVKEDIRTINALLVAKINAMCNASTQEQVKQELSEAKDLLIELFKQNMNRLS